MTTTVMLKTDTMKNPGKRSCTVLNLHKIFVFLLSFGKFIKNAR